MASPQKENGYTAIANEILEHLFLAGINGSEYRILLVVIRKTYGFQKIKDRISLTQFQGHTQMNRPQAVDTIKSLLEKKILKKENNQFVFNKNYEEWVVSKRGSRQKHTSMQKGTTASMQKGTKGSMQKGTHKRKKETITKETSNASVATLKIQHLIKLFEEVNPSYERLYSDKTQRAALTRLVAKHGEEAVGWLLVDIIPKTNKEKYAPTVTTPYELEKNLGKLKAFIDKEKSSKIKNRNTFVV